MLLSLPVTIVMGTFIGGASSRERNLASTSSGGPSSSLSTISRFMFEIVEEEPMIENIAVLLQDYCPWLLPAKLRLIGCDPDA